MFGFTIAAFVVWNKWRLSARLLKIGWGCSFILPLVPAIFPLEHIFTKEIVSAFKNGTPEEQAFFQTYKVIVAVAYMFNILPVVVSLPGGTMRAALRIRALLPESSLSSWILVISSPFYSVLILMALVVILQLAGNFLLILGSLLLTINPWVYVVFRRLLVTVSTEESEKRLDLLQRCIGLSNLVGFVLIIIYIISSSEITEYINTAGVVRFALVGFSRTIITTVLFGDVFLRMSITNWKRDGERRDDNRGQQIDALFESLEGGVGKGSIKKNKALAPAPNFAASNKSGPPQENSGNEATQHTETEHSQHDEYVSSSRGSAGHPQQDGGIFGMTMSHERGRTTHAQHVSPSRSATSKNDSPSTNGSQSFLCNLFALP